MMQDKAADTQKSKDAPPRSEAEDAIRHLFSEVAAEPLPPPLLALVKQLAGRTPRT